jgi:NADH dehydrogenase
MERILLEVTPDLASYAQQQLEERGVEILTKVGVQEATPAAVRLTDGQQIPCGTLIWAAGVMPSPVVQKVDAPKGKQHGLQVDSTLAVPGKPGVWGVGDCAEVPQSWGERKTYAATAQNATREGVHVARNIVRRLRGEELQEFRYTPIGELALVGKKSGVARIYGHNFRGLTAWALWRGVYLAKMPGLVERVRILSDWIADWLFVKHVAARNAPEAKP